MDEIATGALWALWLIVAAVVGAFLLSIGWWFWRRSQGDDALEVLLTMGGTARSNDLRHRMEKVSDISIGAFYEAMRKLQEAEMVTYKDEEGGSERNFFPVRVYTLTDKGRERARRWRDASIH